MLGNLKHEEAPMLCTAEEIIALSGYSTVKSMSISKEIYSKTIASMTEEKDALWTFATALANIYDAGRIQGIREERAKRK